MEEKYDREEHCGFGNPIWDVNDLEMKMKRLIIKRKQRGKNYVRTINIYSFI